LGLMWAFQAGKVHTSMIASQRAAPCQGSRRPATLVVEVKWSTNPETRSALVSQLGQNHLPRRGAHPRRLSGRLVWPVAARSEASQVA
jgi:hypothetical protein